MAKENIEAADAQEKPVQFDDPTPADLQQQITALKTQVTTNQNDISEIKTQSDQNKTDISALKDRVSKLENASSGGSSTDQDELSDIKSKMLKIERHLNTVAPL